MVKSQALEISRRTTCICSFASKPRFITGSS